MKKIFYLLFFIGVFAFLQSCDKEGPGDNYDFSNSVAPYVKITSKGARSAKASSTLNIALDMRNSIQEEVTVTYSVSGAVSIASATAKFAREARSLNAPVVIPAGANGAATFTLLKAVTASGRDLRIGFNNAPEMEKVTINISN